VTLAKLAQAVTLAWGWRRILLAFAAGAAATLALAPVNFWPAPFLCFPILVWLIDGSAAGRLGGALSAAAIGWWFGFGYFVAGLYWIGNALLVDAKTFGWLLPFAVIALPAGLAVFTGLGAGIARAIWSRGAGRILALAVGLTIAEWLRGHLLTGFPWNVFGYALASPLPLAQSAALIGIWGLTFVAVAVYASPAALADERIGSVPRWLAPALSLAVLTALAGFGAWRLRANPTAYVDAVRLRIMQPALQQDEKFNYSHKQLVMSHYLALSDRSTGPGSNGIRDVTLLIWPESAFPFFLTRDAEALGQIASLLSGGTVLITGAVRAPEGVPEAAVTRAYNSVYVIDHDGSILSVYDKVHLVPFGEYLPFQDFLEGLGLRQITNMRGGFIPGDRTRVIKVPHAPDVLPLVCYEAIFPEAIPGGQRPGWMVNLTNDGWFGISAGPYQHFQQARIRAIEQGLPLVRAANTGISAVVDPFGRVTAQLALGTEGVLDARLPQAAAPTPYSRTGDLPAALAVALAAVLALRGRRRPPAISKPDHSTDFDY
jgi:apolipoprotein N-acyltransferase